MKTRIEPIIYDRIEVGCRKYVGDRFVGYVWDEIAYRHYEMFVAKRKLV